MREIFDAPRNALDGLGRPNVGSYHGVVAHLDVARAAPSPLYRFGHHKRWIYLAIATEEVWLGIAVVDLGYIVNSFAFAWDARSRAMLVDRSALCPIGVGQVRDADHGARIARFRAPKHEVRIERPAGSLRWAIEARYPGLELVANVEPFTAAPPLTAIVPIDGGVASTTEKHALLRASGEARIGGRRIDLDEGLAGYDYTCGLLARLTAWRWGFLLGRTKAGAPIGLNLVEGFVGEPECAAWIGDELIGLGEGRFEFDRGRPLSPWELRTTDGAVDLKFAPGAMHAEEQNFHLVASSFIQPVGEYSGAITLRGQRHEIDRALGVSEDQRTLW
jgi:hypothetical protein